MINIIDILISRELNGTMFYLHMQVKSFAFLKCFFFFHKYWGIFFHVVLNLALHLLSSFSTHLSQYNYLGVSRGLSVRHLHKKLPIVQILHLQHLELHISWELCFEKSPCNRTVNSNHPLFSILQQNYNGEDLYEEELIKPFQI